jgi:transposase
LAKLPGKKKRRIGAQKGHQQHLFNQFSDNQIDEVINHELAVCPQCNGKIVPTSKVKKFQQVRFVDKPIFVTEHRQQEYWCDHCQSNHVAPLPSEVRREGLFQSNLTALVGYLKGACHLSFRTMQQCLSDVLGIQVSTGFLTKQIQKVTQSLESPYQELVSRLRLQAHIHSDETGWKLNGKRSCVWALRCPDFSVFHLGGRSRHELYELLGEDFKGVISSDFFSAYRAFTKETGAKSQFCWAHLIREVKFIALKDSSEAAVYGQILLRAIEAMFHTIHRKDKLPEEQWKQKMFQHRDKLLRLSVFEGEDKECLLIMKRFQDWGDDYFRFIETGIPPTNNLAEQTIRNVVLDRRVTQGTRSQKGNDFWERFWTILQTCYQKHINIMQLLKISINTTAHI